MRWCVCDTSPSAVERGRDNEPHVVPPEEAHGLVDQGTVWLYFFKDTDDDDFPNPEKHQFICGVQFWEGWVNQITGGSDYPIMHRVFLTFKAQGLKVTKEQLTQALQEVEQELVT